MTPLVRHPPIQVILLWHIARPPGGVIAGALPYRHHAIHLFGPPPCMPQADSAAHRRRSNPWLKPRCSRGIGMVLQTPTTGDAAELVRVDLDLGLQAGKAAGEMPV